ncbi:MAG: hypothetical protein ACPK85_03545 [Methanosarcina sp.]
MKIIPSITPVKSKKPEKSIGKFRRCIWSRIALAYPIAYSSQVCAIYYQNVINSAANKRKPVEAHPFVKIGKEVLKLGVVPRNIVKDLEEYLKFVEMYTAKHNIEAGNNNLVFDLLKRSDIKLSRRKILLSTFITTIIENNFLLFS